MAPAPATNFHGEWAEDTAMIVRVVNPPNGKTWIYNGYAQKRVYCADEVGPVESLTELPDVLEKWDDKGQYVGRKECKVPSWAEFVRDSDDKPLVMKSGRAPVEEAKPGTLAAAVKPKQVKVGKGRPSDQTIG